MSILTTYKYNGMTLKQFLYYKLNTILFYTIQFKNDKTIKKY